MARWVHRENVAKLPFPDDEEGRALAASIGATVAELNAEAVDDLAADVVFDAMSQTGLIGFAEQEDVDRKRDSFLTSDGAFDAEAFNGALTRSRLNTAAALSVARVVPALILCGLGVHYLPEILEMAAQVEAQVRSNWQHDPWSCFVPVPLLGYVYAAATTKSERPAGTTGARTSSGRALNYQERAIQERDEYYKERMRRKKKGELADEKLTPRFDELFQDCLLYTSPSPRDS